MNDTPFQDFPAYVRPVSKKSRWTMGLVVVLFVLVLLGGGLYFVGGTKKAATKVAPVPTRALVMPSPTVSSQSASATIAPTAKVQNAAKQSLKRNDLKVAILNGSGIAGAAKQTSAHLNGLGYTIVRVGNADDFSYKGFTIKVKKAKSDYLTLLKKDVADNASAGASLTGSVDDTITTDAEVIVGK